MGTDLDLDRIDGEAGVDLVSNKSTPGQGHTTVQGSGIARTTHVWEKANGSAPSSRYTRCYSVPRNKNSARASAETAVGKAVPVSYCLGRITWYEGDRLWPRP
jgi:hypothetical protein